MTTPKGNCSPPSDALVEVEASDADAHVQAVAIAFVSDATQFETVAVITVGTAVPTGAVWPVLHWANETNLLVVLVQMRDASPSAPQPVAPASLELPTALQVVIGVAEVAAVQHR